MSTGRSTRRGFYGVNTTFHSAHDYGQRSGTPDMLVMILAAIIVLLVTAVASDEVFSAAAGRMLSALWSDAIRALTQLLPRSGA
jgi:hypothetical protein